MTMSKDFALDKPSEKPHQDILDGLRSYYGKCSRERGDDDKTIRRKNNLFEEFDDILKGVFTIAAQQKKIKPIDAVWNAIGFQWALEEGKLDEAAKIISFWFPNIAQYRQQFTAVQPAFDMEVFLHLKTNQRFVLLRDLGFPQFDRKRHFEMGLTTLDKVLDMYPEAVEPFRKAMADNGRVSTGSQWMKIRAIERAATPNPLQDLIKRLEAGQLTMEDPLQLETRERLEDTIKGDE